MAPRSPLLDHPRYAQICLQIREWIEERRTVDFIWQGLNAEPWTMGISRGSAWNYTQHVLKGMAKAEAKVGHAKRIARHVATLDRVISMGFDDRGAKYGELAEAVRKLVELQARIDGSLGPTQLELKAGPGSMYARPPEHLVAVLEAATRAQEAFAEEAP
jgi:hypothetical protein